MYEYRYIIQYLYFTVELGKWASFAGCVSLQYQARGSVVRLVEALERACVRFVYFSRENELRSRVFAERLGLEAGWNCHISLADASRARPASHALGGGGDEPATHLPAAHPTFFGTRTAQQRRAVCLFNFNRICTCFSVVFILDRFNS